MARIRTIKPSFFRHAGLYAAERDTGLPLRVAFAGLLTAADREGRFQWRPLELKLDCLPYDAVDFSRVLDALVTRGFLVRYASPDGREFGAIPSWSRHQVINNRESASEIPAPISDVLSAGSTRGLRVADAWPTPLVQVQGEGKGREGKGTGREGEHARPQSALIQAPGTWSKLHSGHVGGFCNWMCLPHDDFTRFSSRIGGDDKAMAWAEGVKASGVVPIGKPWEFWNRRFDADFGAGATGDDDPHAVGGKYDQQLGLGGKR